MNRPSRGLFFTRRKENLLCQIQCGRASPWGLPERMNGYAIGRQNGWLSTNDIRELEDLNRLSDEEGGNFYLINGNMTKLKDAGGFMNPPAGKEDDA